MLVVIRLNIACKLHFVRVVFSWLLSDYVKVSNIATDQMLYTEKDIEASMDRIETVNFHQETEVGGVKFWCYNAGHVLGAAMFMIEIAGVKVCELLIVLCVTMSCDLPSILLVGHQAEHPVYKN